MTEATFPGAALPPRPARLPGGPLPLTIRQGALAAVLVLVVGLGAALLTPVAAALEARRVTPPGSVTAGSVVVLPAPGWSVQARTPDGLLLSRGGARMIVQWQPGPPADPPTALSSLASATQEIVPDARRFGGVRPFVTPSGDPGYLEPFAAAGSTGAIAVVTAPEGEALVQALAPSTTFSQVADDLLAMITDLRIRREGGS